MPETNVINCRAGLKLVGQSTTALWVESPRTGKRVVITDGWWRDLPNRLASRITHATSMGVRLVGFTKEELVALAALAKKVEERCRPLKGGWVRPVQSRWYSGGRRRLVR